jgi:signal transduction histidine kinase/ligand-binding sensor domain-containing protein
VKLFLVILLLSFFSFLKAQQIIARFETLGVNEGLSQNSVYAIYQDKTGFMWFGTADGLNRYDGDEIRVYKIKTDLTKNGNSNFIRGRICEDKDQNVWFSTETGLYYYDRAKDEVKLGHLFSSTKPGIIYYYLLCIDDDQTLWLGNRSEGVSSWQMSSHAWTDYKNPFSFDDSRFTSIDYFTADQNNNLWFSWHKNDGLIRFDTKTKKYDHVFEGKNYLSISFGKGKYFLASENYLFVCDSATARTDSFQLNLRAKKITNAAFNCEDSYGRFWTGIANDGLLCFNSRSGELRQFRRSNFSQKSLSSDIIRSICEDRSGNLWIGTDGGGVCKLDLKPPLFHLFPIDESAYPASNDFFIRSIYEDEQQRVWYGNLNGLNIYDQASGTLKHYFFNENDSVSLPGNIVSALFRDKEGNMWIGNSTGIYILPEKKEQFQRVPLLMPSPISLPRTFVYKIIQLRNGDILAATAAQFQLITKGKNGNFSGRYFSKFNHIVPSVITDLIERDDGLWFLTPVFGLYHATIADDSLVVKEIFLKGIDLKCLHVDGTDAGIFWIGTDKGLIRLDVRSKTHELFDESKGMINSFVYGILEDERQNFWMSTNGGLIYYDRKARLFKNFRVNDGLQSNEFNTGAFYKSPTGNFYFGGVKGFNWFRPEDVTRRRSTHLPMVAVSKLKVNDNIYLTDSAFKETHTLRLKYFENDLSFQLSALDFTLPQANKIQYKLEGWDENWIISYNKNILYSNLPPGSYTFRMKASNSSGLMSREESIRIIISSPFWQTAWFYILTTAFFISAIVVTTRYISQNRLKERIRELEKKHAVEKERNRISKDMHDEIGSGLTRIALMTELMNVHQQMDEKTKHDVNEIAVSSRKLVQTMSEIIWAMNPKNDRLENLLAYLREQTQQYFEPFPVDYRIHFPDEVPDIKLTNEQRRNLFLVSKEALNNALKHSSATTISFSASVVDHRISFSITDNGKGFVQTKMREGANGLRNMQQRMKEIGGDIEWLPQNGTGTVVQYWMRIL